MFKAMHMHLGHVRFPLTDAVFLEKELHNSRRVRIEPQFQMSPDRLKLGGVSLAI